MARASHTVFSKDKRKFLGASILNPTKLSAFQKFLFTNASELEVQLCIVEIFHSVWNMIRI